MFSGNTPTRAKIAMRPALQMLLAMLLPMVAPPALASSPEAWEAHRKEVALACAALPGFPHEGEVTVEVNPFGTPSHGVAIITAKTGGVTERFACVTDKATGAAEMTPPFE